MKIFAYFHQFQLDDVHRLIDTMDYWRFHHVMIHYPIQADDPLEHDLELFFLLIKMLT